MLIEVVPTRPFTLYQKQMYITGRGPLLPILIPLLLVDPPCNYETFMRMRASSEKTTH
jgi:hypothetical protein